MCEILLQGLIVAFSITLKGSEMKIEIMTNFSFNDLLLYTHTKVIQKDILILYFPQRFIKNKPTQLYYAMKPKNKGN